MDLPIRMPNPTSTLDKNLASMGPGILSSIGVGVWRKAPEAFPGSNTTVDTFQSAILNPSKDPKKAERNSRKQSKRQGSSLAREDQGNQNPKERFFTTTGADAPGAAAPVKTNTGNIFPRKYQRYWYSTLATFLPSSTGTGNFRVSETVS